MYEFALNRFVKAKKLIALEAIPEAIELFRSLLTIITDVQERKNVLVEIDHALLLTGRDDEAQNIWAYERSIPLPHRDTIELLVASAQRAKRYDITLARLEAARGVIQPEKILLQQISCRIEQFETEKAAALIASDPLLPKAFTDRFRIQTLLAEARMKELIELIPSQRKGRSVDLLRIRMRALAGVGDYDAVETELQTHREYYPEQKWINRTLAENTTAAKKREIAVTRWRSVFEETPTDSGVLRDYVNALIDNVDITHAQSLVREIKSEHSPAIMVELTAKLQVINGDHELAHATLTAGIEQATKMASLRTVARLWSEKSDLEMRRYSLTGDKMWLDAHLLSAKGAHEIDPQYYQPRIKYIDALIRCGINETVLEEIAKLPKNNRPETLRLAMWRQDQLGDNAGSRKTWKMRRRIHHVPQLENGQKANLTKLDRNTLPPTDALAVYTVLKDERKRLPWFFAYYRKLGVQHFVVVDNGSTDGSVDYLLSQPDVTLYSTQDSYVAAIAGMVWVNHLKNTISCEGWALYVDVDEALVFHNSEGKTVYDLIAVLEERGDEALTGFMLDMYGDRDSVDVPIDDTTDFVAKHPNFLNVHFKNPAPVCPYHNIRGGARSVFGTGEELTKTPLVKVASGVDFLRSSHNITPAKISSLTCALLHFKLIDGLEAEAEAVLADLQRSADCQLRYRKYLMDGNVHDLLKEFEDDCNVYKDSQSLLELSLITPIKEFYDGP